MPDPTQLPETGPGAPTAPIEIAGGADDAASRFERLVPVPDPVIDRLRKTGAEVSTDHALRAEASRDWWPGAMLWATDGEVPGLAGVVVRPADADHVAAVLRVYDAIEADRSYQTGDRAVLLVMDQGDPVVVDAAMTVVEQVCAAPAAGAEPLDDALVGRWLEHRNEVSALEALISKGYVLDTMEIAAPWSRLEAIYSAATAALREVPGAMAASAHQSHSYVDGACLYFTFAGKPESDDAATRDEMYRAFWEAGQRAVLQAGGALSHHHGVGLNRSRFVAEALGDGGMGVLQSVKDSLDPNGILNPGKLGMRSPFGEDPYP